MIGRLRGQVVEHGDDGVILDVHGVGWLVQVPASDVAQLLPGTTATLHVHTLVREDAIQLVGFREVSAKSLFSQLLSVSGLGPKGALALLSEFEPAALARAIHDGDVRALCRARGVGKKTAELIVVSLRERVALAGAASAATTASAGRPSAAPRALRDEVASALANLGYRPQEAAAALEASAPAAGEPAELATWLRAALARMRRDGGSR